MAMMDQMRRLNSNYDEVVASLLLLCRDARFRFDELTIEEVRLLGYGLYSHVAARISNLQFVIDQLEGEVTVCSHLLRYILFVHPTAEQLAQFMLDEGVNDIYLAAHSVVEEYVPRDVPKNDQVSAIRALLLQMMYPGMTVEDNMSALKKEGASDSTIEMSRALCTALVGR